MNYKNLLFTLLITINFMGYSTGTINQPSYSQTAWKSSFWALGGLTAALGLKTAYHLSKAISYSRKYDEYQNARNIHNKDVMNAGRSDFEKTQKTVENHLPTDLARIVTREYDSITGHQYAQENKSLLFFSSPNPKAGSLEKLDTSGSFRSLSTPEIARLTNQQKKISNQDSAQKQAWASSLHQGEKCLQTSGCFIISGLGWASARMFQKYFAKN